MTRTTFRSFVTFFTRRNQKSSLKFRSAKPQGQQLLLELLESRITPVTDTWTNLLGGSWAVGTNWSLAAPPTPTQDAVVTPGGAVTVTHSSGADTVHTLTSDNTLSISGGSLSVTGDIKGTVGVTGSGQLNLTGTAATEQDVTLNVSSGTTVDLTGTLDNTGRSLTVSGGGTLTLLGTLKGGTLNLTGGATLVGQGGTLNGVTVNGNVAVTANNSISVASGLTLNGTMNVGSADGTTFGKVNFLGTQTLAGTGTVVFGDSISNVLNSKGDNGSNPATLTVAASIHVQGGSGVVGGFFSNDSIVNAGTITISAGGTLTVGGANWNNTGTITANGATVNLSGSFTTAHLGNFSANGGTVNLTGALNNTSATLTLQAAKGGSWFLSGGTITGGTINTTDGSKLLLTTSGGTLAGVTIAAGLTVDGTQPPSSLTGFYNFDTGPDDITGNGNDGVLSSKPPQLTSDSSQGSVYKFNAALNNYITLPIDVSPAAMPQMTMGGWFNASNASSTTRGLLSTDDGNFDRSLYVDTRNGGVQWSAFRGGGTVAGGTVVPNQWVFVAVRYDQSAKTMTLDVNGTLTTHSTSFDADSTHTLTIGRNPNFDTPFDGKIDNVFVTNQYLSDNQLAAMQSGAFANVTGGLTLNGMLALGAPDGSAAAHLNFQGSQTLSGTGIVTLGGSAINGLVAQGSGPQDSTTPATLTVGSGITIQGASGAVQGAFPSNDSVVFQGTVTANTVGGAITVNSGASNNLINSKAITASNGAAVTIPESLQINTPTILNVTDPSSLNVGGNLLGTIQNPASFTPQGRVTFNGAGTAAAPQLLEAMSADLGAVPSGFTSNFAYGTLVVGSNTYVKLVDQSDNATGAGSEAVYTNGLVVPAGSTLDLNGLNLYTRAAQIKGTVVNGTITQFPTPDIQVQQFTADGGTTVSVTYTINTGPVAPFDLGFYRSTDTVFNSASDVLLNTIHLTAAADLTTGTHSKSFTLGPNTGQALLPGAQLEELSTDYFLLAVADPTDAINETDAVPVNEDNLAVFSGAYHPVGGDVFVHATTSADTVQIVPGSPIVLHLNSDTFSYAPADVASFRVRLHDGDDTFDGSSVGKPMRIWGGFGNDQMTGGSSSNEYVFDTDVGLGSDTVNDSQGIGTLDFSPTTTLGVSVNLGLSTPQIVNADLTLTLTSAAVENVIGGSASDTLQGNPLDNFLAGGPGNDTYLINADGTSLGSDIITDSGGNDTLDFSASTEDITVDIGVTTPQAVATNFTLTITNTLLDNIIGSDGDDVLTGNGNNNIITGNGGNDTLTGRGGNDTLIGGVGNDTYVFDTDSGLGSDTIDESGGGIDTLDFSPTANLAVNVNLGLAAAQVVNSNLTLTLSNDNTIENVIGGDRGDTLTGNSLNNSLTGGVGNDTYVFTTDTQLGSDTIDESSGGIDTLNFSPTTTKSINVNLGVATAQVVNINLTLTLSDAATIENVVGGVLADNLTGNGLDNRLTGGGGNDTLIGGAGNDTYVFDTDAQLGSDVINESGGGTDTLDFSPTTSQGINVVLGLATAQVVNSNLTLTLSSGNTIENVIGGAGADTITGNSLNNSLTGGAGDDTYVFTADTQLGSDVIDESGGGIDTLNFSSTISQNINVSLRLASAQVVNSNLILTLSSNNTIENVVGGAGDDTITGNSLNNSLTGGAGDDTYLFDTDSQLGSDTIDESGGGNDTLDFSATSSQAITLNLGLAAAQVVNSNLTLTLSSGNTIENVLGGTLADSLTGNSLNNTLTGGAGNDTLIGGAGNDTYVFDTDTQLGSDVINDAGGTDTLDLSATTNQAINLNLGLAAAQVVNSNLTLTLSSGNAIENVLSGAGADSLTGNSLNNTLSGGAGNDTYVFDTDTQLGSDVIDETGGGIDTLDFSTTTSKAIAVNLALATAQVVNSNLTLTLSNVDTIENVLGGSLADSLTGNSLNNSFTGGAGNDTLSGGAGNDTYFFNTDTQLGSDVINESGGGTDTLDFSATTIQAINVNLGLATAQVVNSNLTLTLSSGNTIENVLGGAGDDTLTGNSLDNSLTGGAGNDTYVFNTDTQLGTDVIVDASGGADTLDFSPTTSQAITVDLGLATAQVINSNLTLTLTSGNALENVLGGAGADSLTGNNLINSLTGGAGDDTLTGGSGNDTYVFNTDTQLGSDVIDESGGGTDTLDFSPTTSQGNTVDLRQALAQVVNSNLTLTLSSGNTIENVIGGAGADTITANSRNNTLVGGAGNDTYVFDTDSQLNNDTIDESGGGNDTLDFSQTTGRSVTVDLGQALAQVINSNLTLTLSSGNTVENVIGGTHADSLIGNNLNNSLTGGAGNDTLIGGAGNDSYVFNTDTQLGSDTIDESGGGNDTLDFSPTSNRANTVDLGQGLAQVVNSNLTLTLSSGNAIENVIGGASADRLTGNSLNNTLAGGPGNDIYFLNTDTQLGSDVIDETGGGIDTLDFSATTSKTITVNLSLVTAQVVNSNLTLTFSDGNTIENVIGGPLANSITGNSLNNTFTGGAGNDTLTGGAGDDTYIFDTDTQLGSDVIDESGGGNDTLDFSATTSQAITVNLGLATAQVINSNLTLTLSSGNTVENVLGGSVTNSIIGNSLDNILTSTGSNDSLTGGAGNDTYIFDTDTQLGSDTIDESGGGNDTLDFSPTTSQAINVDLRQALAQVINSNLTLTLSGGTLENVIGGALADTLTGNSLNNSLTGGAGNDTLIGGAGNDTYVFNTDTQLDSDTIDESGGGNDTLDFSPTTSQDVSVSLGLATAQVVNSNLTLTLGSASTIENVVGGAQDDLLTGNSLNNMLNGQGGNDTYIFDTDNFLGSDSISESTGIDTLTFASTTTKNVAINLGVATAQSVNSNLTLTLGSASTIENVVGGTLDDKLTGNSQNNVLNGQDGNDTYFFDTDTQLGNDSISESTGTDAVNFANTTTKGVAINLGVATAQVVNSNLTLTLGSASTIENVVGGTLNDSLAGNSLNNTFSGLGGNDSYVFDTSTALGNDSIIDSGGIDTLDFSASTQAVVVNLGVATAQVVNSNLTLTLGSASTIENVLGGSLNDTLTGNSLNNVLNGQGGNDSYIFDTDNFLGSDTINESTGTDTLNFASTTTKNVAVNLGVTTAQAVNSNLTLTLGSASTMENVLGGTLDDKLTGNVLNNILNGQVGNDTYFFDTDTQLGNDTISESGVGTDAVNFSNTTTKSVAINLGIATAQVVNSNLTLTLGSASTIENVVGGTLNDTLTGNSLNNSFSGLGGNDSYIFDTDTALGNDSITDSAGIDTVDFSTSTTQAVAVNLGVATAQVINSNLTLTLGSASTIENVVGTALNDTLTGNSLSNLLNGGAGSDLYVFDADGFLGSDTISESTGTDTLTFAATTTKNLTVNLGVATAQSVNSNLTLTLGSASTIENVIGGTLDDKLLGNSLNNLFNGGAGNDTYFFDTDTQLGNDTINESGGGLDSVNFSSTTTLNVTINLGVATAQVVNSNLTLTLGSASTMENVVGGTLNDTLTGNSLNNNFNGLAGNDLLTGLDGSDTYVFNTDTAQGSDTISETTGIDTLTFAGTTTKSVTVNLGIATAQVVNSNLTLTLGSTSTIENVVGGTLDDTLTGNIRNNILNGNLGNDTYVYNTDTQQGNDSISESGVGIDTLNFSGTTTKNVAINLGIATTQTVNSNLTLTLGSASTVENVIGGSLNDTLTGNSLNNVLSGGAGNDSLSGGVGQDILIGGAGADTLSGGNDEDVLLGALYSQANNVTALNALMSEWGRTDLAYQQRIDHLTGANTSGANNGSFLLTTGGSPTVTDDAAIDVENGNAGLDWFFSHSGDVTDASGETVTAIP